MSKHTQGPWHYEPFDGGDDSVGLPATPAYVYADPDGNGNVYPICTMDVPCRKSDRQAVDEYDECLEWNGDEEANGRLIAAAPELLHELQHLVRLIEPCISDGRASIPGLATLNAAKAAIAKATGGKA